MGHNITALLLNVPLNTTAMEAFDLRPVALTPSLTLLHFDLFFTAYWQAHLRETGELHVPFSPKTIVPHERVLLRIARALTEQETPRFALLVTDYHAGMGSQAGLLFEGETCLGFDDPAPIDAVLRAFGVLRSKEQDEFDTVGLANHRSNPRYLEKYYDLCDELGL